MIIFLICIILVLFIISIVIVIYPNETTTLIRYIQKSIYADLVRNLKNKLLSTLTKGDKIKNESES
jgi:hypothetical protein